MKAIAVEPMQSASARLEDIPESPHHGFEVDNGDLHTRRALTVVMFVFTRADTGSLKKPPLVTIPAP
jgi:hypothetical protein